MEKAEYAPDRMVMIVDRLDNDVFPTKNAGMKTVRVRQGLSILQSPRDERYVPDFEAASLAGLCRIF